MMDWLALLSQRRFGVDQESISPGRTDFERDYQRILFSYSFRRLQGKTQVFPMPANDHIHNRMVHSLEVASVGRSFGKLCGRVICDRHPDLAQHRHPSDFSDILAAACLAHDLGNPPFGHAGEDAIGRWFREKNAEGSDIIQGLSSGEIRDLEKFEGNAQGFRILTRLSMYEEQGGMRLTHASLASFAKYPQQSLCAGAGPEVGRKKFNFFQSEAPYFRIIAEDTGLIPRDLPDAWVRHPLSFLVEAADDICYSILDAEDGYLIGRFSFDDIVDMFAPISGYTEKRGLGREEEVVHRLRARAIATLVEQVTEAFLDNENAILNGSMNESLLDIIPAAQHLNYIKEQSTEKCYHAKEAVEILVIGYRVISSLLETFLPAVLDEDPDRYAHHLKELLPIPFDEHATRMERIQSVVDYIAGMTDNYAMKTYRRLMGIAMPS